MYSKRGLKSSQNAQLFCCYQTQKIPFFGHGRMFLQICGRRKRCMSPLLGYQADTKLSSYFTQRFVGDKIFAFHVLDIFLWTNTACLLHQQNESLKKVSSRQFLPCLWKSRSQKTFNFSLGKVSVSIDLKICSLKKSRFWRNR